MSVYLADILVFSKNAEEHEKHLREVARAREREREREKERERERLTTSSQPAMAYEDKSELLTFLEENIFYAKLSKCDPNKTELLYLGHAVGAFGVRLDPAKISAVTEWPAPKDVGELQSLLGVTNYFRRFVQGLCTALPATYTSDSFDQER